MSPRSQSGGRRRLISTCVSSLFAVALVALPTPVWRGAAERAGAGAVELARRTSPAPRTERREGAAATGSTLAPADPATRARLADAYGKLPMTFEVNRGQTDAEVRFLSRGQGYTLFLTRAEAVLSLHRGEGAGAAGVAGEAAAGGRAPSAREPAAAAVLRVRPVGGNPAPEVEGVDMQQGKSHHFAGNDWRRWVTNVANYGAVRYQSVYPGVDLVYYGNQQQLEYDFRLAPGADPARIVLAFDGARRVSLSQGGDLLLDTEAGLVRQRRPFVYQEVGGRRREVASAYRLAGDKRVAFELGEYDRGLPLVIDPVLLYSTFLGGNSTDTGLAVAVDASGSAYVTGETFSTNFPATHPTSPSPGSNVDAFVLKLNAAGSARVYGAYVGGGGDDYGYSIAVDAAGNAYVGGVTTSGDFPHTAGALQQSRLGVFDAFVFKLNAAGNALVYSTYLGGDGGERVSGIAVDASGSAYVVGRTDSPGIQSVGVPNNTRGGNLAYRSADGAGNWAEAESGLLGTRVTDFAYDPANAATVYAGTTQGVFKSTDGGSTWQNTPLSLEQLQANDLAVSSTGTVYVATFDALQRSTDGGATFQFKTAGSSFALFHSVAVDPASPSTIYVGAIDGIFKSTDGGDTGTQLPFPNQQVLEIAIAPSNTSTVYAGTDFGLFKTTNGGANWAGINSFAGTFTALAIDPANAATVYAATTSGGVFKSTNGGANWAAANTGMELTLGGQTFARRVESLVIDPSSPSVIYAATNGGGVFKSTDGAAHWAAVNNGMPNRSIIAVALDPSNPSNLLAGANSGHDAFLGKLNSVGTAAVYFRYLGGVDNDEAFGVALDAAGNAYVAGLTASSTFPVTTAFQGAHAGGNDAFVTKVNAAGNALVYSTFLGGSGTDEARAVAVDAGGAAYVTGRSASTNFPVQNAVQATPSFTDAFVTKLNAAGNALVYSTYLGGSSTNEQGNAIAVDAAGNAVVTGTTASNNFPVVAPVQATRAGGTDAFVSKLNAAGTAFLYSTYLGGSGNDQGNAVAADAAGNAYVVGTTSSFNFPVAAAFQGTKEASSDAFIAKLGIVADLSIAKTDARDPVMVNNSLTYTLSVRNDGPDAADGVSVTDNLPAGAAFVSATPSQGSCAGASAVTCDLGTVAAGATATVSIVVTSSATGQLSNTASVTATTLDPNASNNTATQTTTVSALPSIAGRVTGAGGAGLAGVTVNLTGARVAATQTDAAGFYQFAELPPGGSYSVAPARPGFVFNPPLRAFDNLSADATADFGAVACVFTINPTSASFTASGGLGSINVAAPDARCPWTAQSNDPWISVTAGASGAGGGAVSFSVTPTGSSRTGTLTVAGQTFTVFQAVSPCDAPTFTAALWSDAGDRSSHIARGDFNGDGKLDVLVLQDSSQAGPSKAAIMLGRGDGRFDAPKGTTLGGQPRASAVADFNGDGKLDVAAAIHAQATNVAVFLGDGAGNLGAPTFFTAGGLPSSIAVGDFNRDGRADLAVANEDSHNVSILLGNGAGGFGPASHIGGSGSILHSADAVEVGDFNGDGKQDLVVEGSFMWIILGNGDGTFAAPTQINNMSLAFMKVADFNKDGKQDLVGSTGNRAIGVALGDGAGGFAATLIAPTGKDGLSRIVVADFNGDTNLDVAAANAFVGDITLLLGDGTGGLTVEGSYFAGGGVNHITAGDFDGDGRLDVAVNGVFVLRGLPAGGLSAGKTFAAGGPNASLVVSGEFNGDADPDLLVASGGSGSGILGVVSLLPGAAGGNFGPPVTVVENVRVQKLYVRDFNGDGKSDVALLHLNDPPGGPITSSFKLYLGNGQGAFAPASDIALGTANNRNLVFGDFNGDAKLDFVAMPTFNAFRLWLGDGAGHFTAAAATFGSGLNASPIEAGDFNGDGRLDLAAATFEGCAGNSGTLFILPGDGAGNFGAPAQYVLSGEPQHVLVRDLNGDGRPDLILVKSCLGSRVQVFLTNASGGFDQPVEYALDAAPRHAVIDDFDGDGRPDLAVTIDSGKVSVLEGDGAGHFGTPTNFAVPNSPFWTASADFDRDGRADLAVGAAPGDFVSVLLNACPVAPPDKTVQFASASLVADESAGRAELTVTRAGDASAPATVEYRTASGTASDRADFTPALGTLHFAAGETMKTIRVIVTDDVRIEGTEALTVVLSAPVGAFLGATASATVEIRDDDTDPNAPNPIDGAHFFVRQHYADFLNREPDEPGLDFWAGQITSCGTDAGCIDNKRQNVSAAFFLSVEFQQTGYLVYRAYAAAFGKARVGGRVPLTLQEFLPDTQQAGRGVVVNAPGWEEHLEQNKRAYLEAFVTRPQFTSVYQPGMEAHEFVDKLNENAGGVLSPAERDALVIDLATQAKTRAQVLRAVAEDADLVAAEKNRAFVLMQYFGYLRRNPYDPPELNLDFGGYDFWLQKLNQFGGDSVAAQMVRSFLVSGEYRDRFK